MEEMIGQVRAAKAGDCHAYGLLVRRFQDFVFAVCLNHFRSREQAEDTAQEIFLAAFQRLPSLRDEERFAGWLKRLAVNHCLDELRRKQRVHLVSALDERIGWELARADDPFPSFGVSSLESETLLYSSLFRLQRELSSEMGRGYQALPRGRLGSGPGAAGDAPLRHSRRPSLSKNYRRIGSQNVIASLPASS